MRSDFAAWRKSSYSSDDKACVEVAVTDRTVAVRDTKDRESGHFSVNRDDWTRFVTAIRANSE